MRTNEASWMKWRQFELWGSVESWKLASLCSITLSNFLPIRFQLETIFHRKLFNIRKVSRPQFCFEQDSPIVARHKSQPFSSFTTRRRLYACGWCKTAVLHINIGTKSFPFIFLQFPSHIRYMMVQAELYHPSWKVIMKRFKWLPIPTFFKRMIVKTVFFPCMLGTHKASATVNYIFNIFWAFWKLSVINIHVWVKWIMKEFNKIEIMASLISEQFPLKR